LVLLVVPPHAASIEAAATATRIITFSFIACLLSSQNRS
jgi:hypothetical protein